MSQSFIVSLLTQQDLAVIEGIYSCISKIRWIHILPLQPAALVLHFKEWYFRIR